jgi:hypothetical protein
MRIKVSTTVRWPIERQIPAVWAQEGAEVFINQPVPRCDAWVVYQGLHRPEETVVPPEHVFFFSYEPPGLHNYQKGFLAQFAKVVTCQREVQHPNVIFRHQAQPWLAGIQRHASENRHEGYGVRLSYEDFVRMDPPLKSRRLSVLCSRKVVVPGHQARLDFVAQLEKEFGKKVDVFGYGFEPIVDKWDALAPYEYHLALENSCVPDYWTEKVSDAFLAWCVPVVWGCPNLVEYFPKQSFVALDPTNREASLARIRETISKPPTKEQQLAVAEARRRVMEDYNLFPEIRRLVETSPCAEARRIHLRDERLFLPGSTLRPLVRALTDRWRANA